MAGRRPKLILIDGNSIAYRAFFALPALSNAEGQFTNAVFGFTQMLLKLLQDESPTHIAVAFDAGKETFRHGLYEAYKGTREKTPGELSEQFPLLREVLQAFSIPALEVPNYEADDIIGTLSKRAEEAGMDTLIVSGDKDLLQLVSERVHAALTRKGITEMDRYDPQAVFDRFGLTPAQIIDLKGLMGDASDNIPGVPGVGEKTAVKLLQAHGSVEEVLAHTGDVSGVKLRERLETYRDQALLSKQLATIHRDAPVDWGVDDLAYTGYNPSEVRRVFQRLGFRSLLDKIPREIDTPGQPSTTSDGKRFQPQVQRIETLDAYRQWVRRLTSPIGILPVYDREDYQTARLLGVAVGCGDQAWLVSFESELGPTDLMDLWQSERDKVVFDLKSLAVLLDGHGITLENDGTWFDVMLGSYLLNPSDGEVSLSDIVERETHRQVAPAKPGEPGYAEAQAHLAACLPALRSHLFPALEAQEVDHLYGDIELPLEFVLARMEVIGFRVNQDKLRAFGAELERKLAELTKRIHERAGMEFNINSPKQLGEVLFDKLGLPALKKTKTGYSTSADVLEKLAPYNEIVQDILEYRMIGKLLSTYVEGLLKVIRPETGRVHTRFHQALTATGRLSSSEPNLQNIPIRMEEGRELRKAFEPTYEDWVILSADYSQIELRVLAHLSGDEALLDAFRSGADIHASTAATVFEVPMDQVTPAQRRQAKAVNFGIVYGISDYGLSQNLNIPRKQAAQFIEEYFRKFPGVARYMQEIVETARKQGYVTTLLNRRRYLPDIHSRNFNQRSFAERTAMNTPIQGSAADIIKLAMVRIDRALAESGLQARMLLQVHDELIFECPEAEADRLAELVQENMENALTLNVPLKVDIHTGKTWYDAK
ncbi:DNA polymerase I [Alicyclobacillus macrosporangiidus]|uniref:DNA polymerase I n=1 Tax=Alicyclobacillus macrosporangiidus TaxID=392015 RepID=A0A1I7GB41_9BACL|nr:DNA polymerase I [Alicyclobacillus macrosporangiidus]SFU45591.1 DNA polymerase I [Alicyclobacillus macrosporangiidus]